MVSYVKSEGPSLRSTFVDANAETDRFLCSPQDPVQGMYTRGVVCNTYGLIRYSNTWGNRHGVVVHMTWDRG
jgi:hypothetical protein